MRSFIEQIFKRLKVPIISNKRYSDTSLFLARDLIKECRRQNQLSDGEVPKFVVLDPDGDILKYLQDKGLVERSADWGCYHTSLFLFKVNGVECGIVANVVGGSFAVLVAEQLFESGCTFLMSITSAGKISQSEIGDYILIEKALRDEGVSYHYLPPSKYSYLSKKLLDMFKNLTSISSLEIKIAAVWTTAAPYRETAYAINYARRLGLVAVEMECASLYAYASANNKSVLCFAHLTNETGYEGDNFEKGRENGALKGLKLVENVFEKVQANGVT